MSKPKWMREGYAYWHFARTRGKETLQPLEQPLKIAVIGTPGAHYLGLSATHSVLLGLAFIICWELAMLVAGYVDHRIGTIRRQQEMVNQQDPWKVATQDLLERILKRLG